MVLAAFCILRFQWGAAKIPIMYDAHSWGEEGSTISNQFIRKFFQDAVLPKLGRNYEVLSIFIQQSDDFAKISPEFLLSICRGRTLCSLYFLWPIQGLQSYGALAPKSHGFSNCKGLNDPRILRLYELRDGGVYEMVHMTYIYIT